MKRLSSLFLLSYLLFSTVGAQFNHAAAQTPSWAKKATQAVFTLKTFGADGSLLASSNGFFVSDDGYAVSAFTPFKGAHRAVVIDAQGKEWPVSTIVGANDMYDVAKFQVDGRKFTALTPAAAPAANGTTVWLLPYSAKKEPTCVRGTVSQAETFQERYSYYTLALTAGDQQFSSPVLNDQGQVLGLIQPSASSQQATSYAVSAAFAADMRATGLNMNDPALRSTAVAKALPDEPDQAVLSLFMATTTLSADQYNDYLERFIRKFPNSPDGYIYRARLALAANDFASADTDMKQAVKVADRKDDAHYQYAQMIYQKELYQSDQPYDGWTLDRALEESRAAYDANPLPVYRQQQAQILYAQQQYDDAFAVYDELSHGDLRSADNFYAAAQCKLQKDDKRAAVQLLDSAVNMFTRPYVKTAAPYLQARAQLSMDIRRYQQALNDMQDVVALEPNDAEMWARKASYELRVNLFDQALESAAECIRLAPDYSDGYLMSGIARCAKGDTQQGLPLLHKAQELGNSQAQTFIDKYSH